MTGERRNPPPADPMVWPVPSLVRARVDPVRESWGRAVARAQLAAEKADAITTIEHARTLLAVVEPEGLRTPLDLLFRATLERIRAARTLLGLPVMHVLDMAGAIIMEQARRDQ